MLRSTREGTGPFRCSLPRSWSQGYERQVVQGVSELHASDSSKKGGCSQWHRPQPFPVRSGAFLELFALRMKTLDKATAFAPVPNATLGNIHLLVPFLCLCLSLCLCPECLVISSASPLKRLYHGKPSPTQTVSCRLLVSRVWKRDIAWLDSTTITPGGP